MPLLTVEQLRVDLQWEDIREEPMPKYGMRWFHVVPAEASLPSIDFLFDDAVTVLRQIGSGEWHCHPDELSDAIDTARKLIRHELCILEQRTSSGAYMGSGPETPDGIARTLRSNAAYLMRRFFGKPAVREAIDFSQYVADVRLYIEQGAHAEYVKAKAAMAAHREARKRRTE